MARLLSQEPAVSAEVAEAVGNLCTAATRASEDTKGALMDSAYPDVALVVAGTCLDLSSGAASSHWTRCFHAIASVLCWSIVQLTSRLHKRSRLYCERKFCSADVGGVVVAPQQACQLACAQLSISAP